MYDVAIIGSGPAGITAAIYCARFKLKTLLVSYNVGGWVNNAYIVENMSSQPRIGGAEIVKGYKEQIKANDIDLKIKESITSIEKSDEGFDLKSNKGEYSAKYVIYALGTKKRMLNVPGESKFLGKGVHTCATCDAPFFSGKTVAVIGGNDAGAKTSLLLSEYCEKVYVVEFQEKMPTEPMWLDKMEANEKIEIITGATVKEIRGEEAPESVLLTNDQELDVQGVFIEIGSDPNIALAKKAGVKIDEYNCIDVNAAQETSVDGLYAVGDVTNGSNYVRQIATAQGEGAIAASAVYKRIMQEK